MLETHVARFQRRGFRHEEAVVKCLGGRVHSDLIAEVFRAVQCSSRGNLLIVAGAVERTMMP